MQRIILTKKSIIRYIKFKIDNTKNKMRSIINNFGYDLLLLLIKFFEWLVFLDKPKCPKCGAPLFQWSNDRWDCTKCTYKRYI